MILMVIGGMVYNLTRDWNVNDNPDVPIDPDNPVYNLTRDWNVNK